MVWTAIYAKLESGQHENENPYKIFILLGILRRIITYNKYILL